MEPGPDPRSSIVAAELPADPQPEEVTEQWQTAEDLSGTEGDTEGDTDPFGFPPVDRSGDVPGAAPGGEAWAEQSTYAGAEVEWAQAPEAADASPGDDGSAWSVAAPGWTDAYVADDSEWASPYEAAEIQPTGEDAEWTVPQDGARAAFVGADPRWDTTDGVAGGLAWDPPHDEQAVPVAGAEPGWPAPPDAGVDATGAYHDRPKPHGRKIGFALLAVALLGAGAIVSAGLIDSPRTTSGAAAGAPPGVSQAPGRAAGAGVLTAPLDGLGNAVFALADGATSVRLHAADLGGDLYRISAPAGSGLLPRVVRSGAEVRLFLSHSGQSGTGVVDVAVNATVGWTLHLDAGVAESVLDMGAGKVDGVDLAGGASRIELILPKPKGVLAVRMTGGVDQFLVRLAKLTPVRVQADSGAGEVTVGGSTYRGIARGRSFTANGWVDGTPGVDVQAVAGMAALTVTES